MAYDESEHNPGGASGGAGSTGKGGKTGGSGGERGGVSGAYNSTPNVNARNPITGAALQNQADYANVGNTTEDDIGNAIAAMLGFHEMDPTKMNQKALQAGSVPQTNADWGFDPIGAALGVGGMATGLPLGTAYSGLRALTNATGLTDPDWGMINMGPDVIGGIGKSIPGATKGQPGIVGSGKGGGTTVPTPMVSATSSAPTASVAPNSPILNSLLGRKPVVHPPIVLGKPPVTKPPVINPLTNTHPGKPVVKPPIVGKPTDPIPLKPEPHLPNPPTIVGPTVGGKPPVTKPPVTQPGGLLGGLPPAQYKLLSVKLGYHGDPNQFQGWLKAHGYDNTGNPIPKPPVPKPPVPKPPVPPPPKPPVVPPTVPTTLPASWAAELAKFTPQLRSDFDWNMTQRGLNPKAPIGQVFGATNNDWENAFTNELNHRISEVPLGTTSLTDQAKIDAALNQYLLPNFGSSALDDYQTRMRSTMSNNPILANTQKTLDDKFSLTGVQPYLDSIYNTQFGQAKQLMDNTKARGEFNDLGYSTALKDLNDQGVAGKSKLSDLAQGFLTSDKGTVDDALSGIYNKIGGYSLGSGYDPNNDLTNVNTQANSLYGNLKGQIMGAAPSIFDTSTTMQKAGTQQGMTSTGSLLDTLSQRNTNLQNRGLGSTGAF